MSHAILNILIHLLTIQVKQKVRISSRNSARRALGLARAVRTTLEAQSHAAAMQIAEMEEYVGLMRLESESITDLEEFLGSLRQRKAVIDLRGLEADEQIGAVRQILDNHGIPETPLSRDEQSCSQPLPSYTNSDIDSDLSDDDSRPPSSKSMDVTHGDQLSARQRALAELFQRTSRDGHESL